MARAFLPALLLASLLASGCDTSGDALPDFTRTNEAGEVVGRDAVDDWRPRCPSAPARPDSAALPPDSTASRQPLFCLSPAYPNPAAAGEEVTFPVAFRTRGLLTLYAEDASGAVVDTIRRDQVVLSDSLARVSWRPPASLPGGLYRIVVEADAVDGTYLQAVESYGDVRLTGRAE